MKSYRECMLLSEQRKDSERDLREAQNRLTEIYKMLDTRLDNQRESGKFAYNEPAKWVKNAEKLNTRARKRGKHAVLGSIAVSVLWIVIYFAIFAFASSVPWRGAYFMRPIMVVSCLLMGIVMLVSEYADLKYISSITAYKQQIQQMIGNLELSAASLPEKERVFCDAASKFDYPLLGKQEKSVVAMGVNIRETVSSMEKFSSKYLEIAKTVLYYVTMICVTIVCAAALQGTVNYVLYSSFEFLPSTGVYIAVVLAVIAAQVFIGRRFWAMTNCTVTNVTLLMTASGPVFIGLTILGLIVIGGIIMIVIALALAALAIGIACGISGGG